MNNRFSNDELSKLLIAVKKFALITDSRDSDTSSPILSIRFSGDDKVTLSIPKTPFSNDFDKIHALLPEAEPLINTDIGSLIKRLDDWTRKIAQIRLKKIEENYSKPGSENEVIVPGNAQATSNYYSDNPDSHWISHGLNDLLQASIAANGKQWNRILQPTEKEINKLRENGEINRIFFEQYGFGEIDTDSSRGRLLLNDALDKKLFSFIETNTGVASRNDASLASALIEVFKSITKNMNNVGVEIDTESPSIGIDIGARTMIEIASAARKIREGLEQEKSVGDDNLGKYTSLVLNVGQNMGIGGVQKGSPR